ncbi:MAG TPA: protein-methionine-sulfoxide reductase catalytic subunit MsrP, partial [Reyranella sp.]
MLIKRPKGWELPERAATSEGLHLRRREAVKAMGLGAVAIAAPVIATPGLALADGKYPAPRNDKYGKPEPITDEKLATTYNNFYEFSDDKDLWHAAQKLKISPWTIKVSGKVKKPFEIGFDDLMAKMPLEERVYRHRCVETWSMIVPWSGFPLKSLVEFCKPVNNPQYIVMQTAMDTKAMPGLEEVVYPWPYVEGLAMDEAMNDLAFIATGLYGKPIPKQNG